MLHANAWAIYLMEFKGKIIILSTQTETLPHMSEFKYLSLRINKFVATDESISLKYCKQKICDTNTILFVSSK